MSVEIEGISASSPAFRIGLKAGMNIISINDHNICDGLDYEFYSADTKLKIIVENDGIQQTLSVEKDVAEPLGCEFATYLIDKHHTCRNKCVFCFIDQMPKGMRKSLYFKDDDERLSFLFGNYVTLTNLTDKEINRIIEMKISPVNISVHTTNPKLRVQMMGNPHAGEVLEFIPRLANAGIELNCQLVLCPGINDGVELAKSIQWLAQFRPAMQSIAAVPVGLSKHRENLANLCAYTQDEAAKQLEITLSLGDKYAKQDGVRLIYPSDEWFLLAGMEIPMEDFYDGYPQLENGVGMWRLFWDDFTATVHDCNIQPPARSYDLATGKSAYPLIQKAAKTLQQKFPQVNIQVHAIENDFFGHSITVAGLLTGQDIIAQLKGRLHSKNLVLPQSLLRTNENVLLDDLTPNDIEKDLEVNVLIAPSDGAGLADLLLGNAQQG